MKNLVKIISLIVLIVILMGITYIIVPRPYQVHWHANFAVYIDGKKWDFSRDIYMEEVARCNITEGVEPEDRIHLHENNGDTIHIHMAASTWGHLFSNLAWNFGSGYLVDDYGKMYLPDRERSLSYFVNGERVTNPHNRIVESEDQLLVWYGTGDTDMIEKDFATLVSENAHEYNLKPDPASCGSNTYGWFSPIMDRLHNWFDHHDE